MHWFFREKPKIKVQTTKKDGFSGWLKCSQCQELIHMHEIEKNVHCCPLCECHYRMSPSERISLLTDAGHFEELFANYQSTDPLQFSDLKPYKKRLEEAKKKSEHNEAVVTGKGKIDQIDVMLAVFDFQFMGGSMGAVVGEKITLLIERAIEQQLPVIIVSSSGGARMQESIFSLMQMAKTAAALGKLHQAKLPYLSILTNPTCGGVTASFASLGDIILAEPNALICFAGPRVIEQTIREKMPKGAQRSQFLLEHGMIDAIVERKEMKRTISHLLRLLLWKRRARQSATRSSASPKLVPQWVKECVNQ